MALKTTITIPQTQSRTSSSVDFSGFVYPQFISTNGFNALGTALSKSSNKSNAFVQQQKDAIRNQLFSNSTGSLIAGVKKFTKSYSRDIMKRNKLGNFESFQTIAGKIGLSITLDKVVFYKDNNQLDGLLYINYDGAIKQFAPLMLVETLQSPNGDVNTIIYLDCWFKSSKIDYGLENNVQVVNSLTIECAKSFTPFDANTQFINEIYNKFGITTNAIESNIEISSIL